TYPIIAIEPPIIFLGTLMSKSEVPLDDQGSWIWMDKAAREPNLVLFIHGYTGHPDATWVKFPHLIMRVGEGFARHFEVASFGYSSKMLLNCGKDIRHLAERLLTFIDARAHENT